MQSGCVCRTRVKCVNSVRPSLTTSVDLSLTTEPRFDLLLSVIFCVRVILSEIYTAALPFTVKSGCLTVWQCGSYGWVGRCKTLICSPTGVLEKIPQVIHSAYLGNITDDLTSLDIGLSEICDAAFNLEFVLPVSGITIQFFFSISITYDWVTLKIACEEVCDPCSIYITISVGHVMYFQLSQSLCIFINCYFNMLEAWSPKCQLSLAVHKCTTIGNGSVMLLMSVFMPSLLTSCRRNSILDCLCVHDHIL